MSINLNINNSTELQWNLIDYKESQKTVSVFRTKAILLLDIFCSDKKNNYILAKEHYKKLDDNGFGDKFLNQLADATRELMKTKKQWTNNAYYPELDKVISTAEKQHNPECVETNDFNLLLPKTIALKNEAETSVEMQVLEKPMNKIFSNFRTARKVMSVDNQTKNTQLKYGSVKKSLGNRCVLGNFVAPIPRYQGPKENDKSHYSKNETNPNIPNIDENLIDIIKSEIMHKFEPIDWDGIAGLEEAKKIIFEAVVLPMQRPDIFKGLRRPPRGILLFGPPGTGKTLIAKCIASQSGSTFFSINPSTLTSKWIGEGEKLVKALFIVASQHQPAVVFIDEIDSLLTQRSESEHESSRRLKNEFLIQLDGAATSEDERLLVIGATNRPQELDEAARRRFVRRLYIPLPNYKARIKLIRNLLKEELNYLNSDDIEKISNFTEGYSGADIKTLCCEAAMQPIRAIPFSEVNCIDIKDVRPVDTNDFIEALKSIRSTVSEESLKHFEEWNNLYGNLTKL